MVAPKDGSAITLPASLSVEMAPNLTGPVTVAVEAIDGAGFVIASGMTTQQDINVGGQTIVVVTLVSGLDAPGRRRQRRDSGDRRQRWNRRRARVGRNGGSAGPAVWGPAGTERAAAERAARGPAAAERAERAG